MLDIPDMPGICSIPDIHDIPGMPGICGIPDIHDIPAYVFLSTEEGDNVKLLLTFWF